MKVIISGAGIAGLSLAQRLTAAGWDVTVIERSPRPRYQGYMIDFWGLGYDAAHHMGVLRRMQELSYRVVEACFVDDSGRRRAGLSYARFERALNGRLLSIMRPDLELVLREQVAGKVDLRFGCSIASIENSAEGVQLTLTGGTVLGADLLVGADGIHSTVRRMVFGEEKQFLRAPDPTLPADPQAAVREAYSSLGWAAPQALAKCPPSDEVYYDQVAQIEIPQWTRQRVTLLGDACQAVSLLAGQGASLAIAGAYVLGEQLASADSIDAALTRYQRIWQPLIAEKQRIARRGVRWFQPSSSRQLLLRRIFLKLTSFPGIDRYVGTALVGKSTTTIEQLTGTSRVALPVPRR